LGVAGVLAGVSCLLLLVNGFGLLGSPAPSSSVLAVSSGSGEAGGGVMPPPQIVFVPPPSSTTLSTLAEETGGGEVAGPGAGGETLEPLPVPVPAASALFFPIPGRKPVAPIVSSVVTPSPSPSFFSGEGGRAHLQLTSVREEEVAWQEWKRLQARFPDVLKALSAQVVRVEIPERGIFYRLIAGPVTKESGSAACRTLRDQGRDCIVRTQP
jgi:hypothetical protein